MSRSAQAPKHRILWVDDQPEGNRDLVLQLEERGIHVSYALTTRMAEVLLSKNRYDAIVSDMARADGPAEGLRLLDAIRARRDRTPFFVYAGHSAASVANEALIRGAQGTTNDGAQLLHWLTGLVDQP